MDVSPRRVDCASYLDRALAAQEEPLVTLPHRPKPFAYRPNRFLGFFAKKSGVFCAQ